MGLAFRIIDTATFQGLLDQEKKQGNTIVEYKIAAIPFFPPRPGEEEKHHGLKYDVQHHYLLLNVIEPMIYKDPIKGKTFVILNAYNHKDFTYEQLEEVHLVKGAWCYRLSPEGWNGGDWSDKLDEAVYVFNHGEIKEAA